MVKKEKRKIKRRRHLGRWECSMHCIGLPVGNAHSSTDKEHI